MKVSLKEAYEHARKALPGFNVKVQVEIGDTYGRNDESIKWSLSARKDKAESKDQTFYANDEIFAVALANLSAEIKGKEMAPIEDVVVSSADEKPGAEKPQELPPAPAKEGEINF